MTKLFITRNYLPRNKVHELKSSKHIKWFNVIRDILACIGGMWVVLVVWCVIKVILQINGVDYD